MIIFNYNVKIKFLLKTVISLTLIFVSNLFKNKDKNYNVLFSN